VNAAINLTALSRESTSNQRSDARDQSHSNLHITQSYGNARLQSGNNRPEPLQSNISIELSASSAGVRRENTSTESDQTIVRQIQPNYDRDYRSQISNRMILNSPKKQRVMHTIISDLANRIMSSSGTTYNPNDTVTAGSLGVAALSNDVVTSECERHVKQNDVTPKKTLAKSKNMNALSNASEGTELDAETSSFLEKINSLNLVEGLGVNDDDLITESKFLNQSFQSEQTDSTNERTLMNRQVESSKRTKKSNDRKFENNYTESAPGELQSSPTLLTESMFTDDSVYYASDIMSIARNRHATLNNSKLRSSMLRKNITSFSTLTREKQRQRLQNIQKSNASNSPSDNSNQDPSSGRTATVSRSAIKYWADSTTFINRSPHTSPKLNQKTSSPTLNPSVKSNTNSTLTSYEAQALACNLSDRFDDAGVLHSTAADIPVKSNSEDAQPNQSYHPNPGRNGNWDSQDITITDLIKILQTQQNQINELIRIRKNSPRKVIRSKSQVETPSKDQTVHMTSPHTKSKSKTKPIADAKLNLLLAPLTDRTNQLSALTDLSEVGRLLPSPNPHKNGVDMLKSSIDLTLNHPSQVRFANDTALNRSRSFTPPRDRVGLDHQFKQAEDVIFCAHCQVPQRSHNRTNRNQNELNQHSMNNNFNSGDSDILPDQPFRRIQVI
jgi:hypothetical protein